ncbi:MAG: hypothetical protein JXR96_06980, partial [Deltaproteobacteria bacterium]|nr:hypothetical protein [Deltaproteobacteria bacterium]
GDCDTACDPGYLCDGSGHCALSCQAGLSDCGGTCVDTASDPLHCGGCAGAGGVSCESDQACVASICTPLARQPGEVLWTVTWDQETSEGRAVAVDGMGHVFVAATTSNGSDVDMTLAKVDPDGALLWDTTFDSGGSDFEPSLAVDGMGYALVACPIGWADVWLARYNPEGALLWSRTWDGGDWDWTEGVAVDGSGNAIVVATSDNGSDYDIWIGMLDPEGVDVWDLRIDSGSDETAADVATDGMGNILVLGQRGEVLLQKLDTQGNVLWTSTFGSAEDEAARAVTCDGSGDVLVSCRISDSAGTIHRFDADGIERSSFSVPGDPFDLATDGLGEVLVTGRTGASPRLWVAKYDIDGAEIWLDTVTGQGQAFGYSIDSDGLGRVVAAGYVWPDTHETLWLRQYAP